MKIKIQIPDDASVKFVEGSREIVVEPFFATTVGLQPAMYLTVVGDGGAERRSTVNVNCKTGVVSARGHNSKRVSPVFDTLSR